MSDDRMNQDSAAPGSGRETQPEAVDHDQPEAAPGDASAQRNRPADPAGGSHDDASSSAADADTNPGGSDGNGAGSPTDTGGGADVAGPTDVSGGMDEAASGSGEAAAGGAGPGEATQPGDLAPEQTDGGAEAAASAEPPAAIPAVTREPDEDSLRLAEALVFSSAEPVTPRALARILPDDIDADTVLSALRTRYAGRGVELIDAGAGVMFRTAVDLAPRLRKVIESPRRLPRVALETLAIVAYHQPMTRPEIEHIRGSALSQQTLDSLLELNLIAPKGRRETPGRPTLWGTTPEFLVHFGLKDLRELPRREDLLLEPTPPRPESVTADLQPPSGSDGKQDRR